MIVVLWFLFGYDWEIKDVDDFDIDDDDDNDKFFGVVIVSREVIFKVGGVECFWYSVVFYIMYLKCGFLLFY